MITIIENPKTNSLTESMQANDIKFAFASAPKDGAVQLQHVWVKCREYFNELLMINHHPQDFKWKVCYGFKYEYDQYPLDLSCTRIALKFPNLETQATFLSNIAYLHHIEDKYKLERTVVEETQVSNILVVTGSKFWIQKCLLLNIYTMILKLCSLGMNELYWDQMSTKRVNGDVPSEIYYINNITFPVYEAVLNNLDTLELLESEYVDGWDSIPEDKYVVHGYRGIRSIYYFAIGQYEHDQHQAIVQWMKDVIKQSKKNNKKEAA